MQVEGSGCNSKDTGISSNNISSTLQSTTSTNTNDSSMMNLDKNDAKSDLCMKRKAGEMEPMENQSLKTNHFGDASEASSMQCRRRGEPPLKKRLSLDLLSEASAMLAQGLGPSRIQEIVKQKEECESAAAMKMSVSESMAESSAVSDSMAEETNTANGETSSSNSELPQEKAMNDAPTSEAPLNGGNTTPSEASEQMATEEAPQEDQEAKQQEAPMETESPAETDNAAQNEGSNHTNPELESVATDAPIRTVSEADCSVKETQEAKDAKKDESVQPALGAEETSTVEKSDNSTPETSEKESHDAKVDDTKMGETAAEETSSVEKSENLALDEAKEDIPMQSGDNSSGKVPESTPDYDAKKDTIMQPVSDAPDSAAEKESQTVKADEEPRKDIPMEPAPQADSAVKESGASLGDDETKDEKMEPVSDAGTSVVEGSQDTKADEAPKDASMSSVSEEDKEVNEPTTTSVDDVNKNEAAPSQSNDQAVEESRNATLDNMKEDMTVETSAEADGSVHKSLDADMNISAANGSSETSASFQTPATSEEQPKEEAAPTEEVKEVKDESTVPAAADDKGANMETEEEPQQDSTTSEKVEEAKAETVEPTATDDAVKGAAEGDLAPTDDNVQKPSEGKEDAMDIDAPAESKGGNEEPVSTGETKVEGGDAMVTDDQVTENKDASPQPEADSEVPEPPQQENQAQMATNGEFVEDKKEENKEPTATDKPLEETMETNPETMAIDETVEETKESNEAPVVSDEPSKAIIGELGEPVTSDEAAKIIEDGNVESMAVDGSIAETKATDIIESSSESQNMTSTDEPGTSDPPTAPSVKNAEGMNGMIGHGDSSKSLEEAPKTETNTVTDGENVPSSDSRAAPNGEKKVKTKHMDPQVLEIRKRIQFGCRDNDLVAAMEAYDEAIEKNIKVEAQSFYNLLNLCDGLERSVHVGTPKDRGTSSANTDEGSSIDEETRLNFAFRLREHMKKLNLPLNETAYSAIVKLLAKAKEYDKALEILKESETVQQCKPKLRLYSSLLIAYCEDFRMLDALEIWKKLTSRKLHLSEKEYAALMQCAIGTGDCIVFERVLTDLAEDVLVPAKGTLARILEWFELAHSFHTTPLTKRRAEETKVIEYLEGIHSCEKETPPRMGPVVNVNQWQVSSACPIDTKTGTLQTGCLKGCQLNPVSISQRAWDEMRDMNEKIVIEGQVEGHKTEFAGGKKGKKRMDFSPQERRMEWDRFTKFLDSIGHVDVVIDGANVGCFSTNFNGAPKHIDYHQIDWIVQHFAKRGKKVLLVLHERHFAKHQMPDNFRWLEHKWMKNKNLYKTPRGMNDDWFWLHVAYVHQSLVVSNDEMRDHHFQMLAPRTFLRWKERHHAHFDFGSWIVGDDGTRQRQVLLTLPEAYSRRLQRVEDGLVVPLAKRGDKNRFMDGAHLTDDDEPEEETYLCIRPNQQPQQA